MYYLKHCKCFLKCLIQNVIHRVYRVNSTKYISILNIIGFIIHRDMFNKNYPPPPRPNKKKEKA